MRTPLRGILAARFALVDKSPAGKLRNEQTIKARGGGIGQIGGRFDSLGTGCGKPLELTPCARIKILFKQYPVGAIWLRPKTQDRPAVVPPYEQFQTTRRILRVRAGSVFITIYKVVLVRIRCGVGNQRICAVGALPFIGQSVPVPIR